MVVVYIVTTSGRQGNLVPFMHVPILNTEQLLVKTWILSTSGKIKSKSMNNWIYTIINYYFLININYRKKRNAGIQKVT